VDGVGHSGGGRLERCGTGVIGGKGLPLWGSAFIPDSVDFAATTPAPGRMREINGVETGRKKLNGGKARTTTCLAVLRVLLGRGRTTHFHSGTKLIDHVRSFAAGGVYRF